MWLGTDLQCLNFISIHTEAGSSEGYLVLQGPPKWVPDTATASVSLHTYLRYLQIEECTCWYVTAQTGTGPK